MLPLVVLRRLDCVLEPTKAKVLKEYEKEVKLVTPGIRSVDVPKDDQERTGTPAEARKAGATLLVIGRQITNAQDPVAALDRIEKELAESA